MMATLPVRCPCCGSAEVIKAGKQPNGAQRYRCQHAECSRTIFQLDYSDQGRLPAVKRQIVKIALNGSGIRDTARVLGVAARKQQTLSSITGGSVALILLTTTHSGSS